MQKTPLLILVVLITFCFIGTANATVIILVDTHLNFDDGSYAILHPGTYTSLYRQDNVWYVNGEAYYKDIVPATNNLPGNALMMVLSPIYSGVILFGVMILAILGFMIVKGNINVDNVTIVIMLIVTVVICVAVVLAIMSGVSDVGNRLF